MREARTELLSLETVAGAVRAAAEENGSALTFSREILYRILLGILDVFTGSSFVKVPDVLLESLRAANRTCRFIVDGDSQPFGTGFLIGPDLVLTAAHLFFRDDRKPIDEERVKRIKVEFQHILIDELAVMAAGSSEHKLKLGTGKDWVVSPKIGQDGLADREVVDLDYALLRLEKDAGNEMVGRQATRGWLRLPNLDTAPILGAGRMLRLFQHIDAGVQQSTIGTVKKVLKGKFRVQYTASTRGGASGSPVLDDQYRLAGLHVGGSDETDPEANNGLPIRRVVESLKAHYDLDSLIPADPILSASKKCNCSC